MSKDIERLQGEQDQPAPQPQPTHLKRAALVRSRTNPRRNFDEAYLRELGSSIRQHGILQPLLARPLPADRLQETFEDREPGQPLPTHEIVCGECRYRAAGLEGVEDIPVLVRELDDLQVLQVQLVENLKRLELHPLEEAEGFERLLKDHHMSAEQIADSVRKSVSYVYKSLKLLELTPECRQEMYAGNLSQSVALLVARAPTYLQAQIAKDVMKPDWQGEPMSFRQAVKHIQQHYMLQLGAAVFDIKDVNLVAKAGSCVECPKRTGANTQLFGDIEHADTCTDPKCFDAKKEAHHAAVAAAAAAAGKTVIQGKAAAELVAYPGATPKGYKLLDEKDYIEGRTTSVRSAIGKEALASVKTVLIVDPHTKETREALPADVAGTLLAKAKKRIQGEKAAKDGAKEPTKQELERQYREQVERRVLTSVHQALKDGGIENIGHAARVQLLRQIGVRYAESIYDHDGQLGTLLGIGKVGQRDGLEDHLRTCPEEQVAPAVMLMMLLDEFDSAYGGKPQTQVQELLTEQLGIDLEDIHNTVKVDMKRAAEERKAAAQGGKGKPAGKKPAAKKPKTTQAEAAAGIAQALQEQENEDANGEPKPIITTAKPQVGCRVRVKADAKGPGGKYRKIRGLEGSLTKHAGGDDWMVQIEQLEYRVAVDQFDIIDTAAGAAWPFPKLQPQQAWPFPVADEARP